MKLKVFAGTPYGRNRFIVAAKSKKRAAELMRISYTSAKNFLSETGNDFEVRIAMENPEVLFWDDKSVENGTAYRPVKKIF